MKELASVYRQIFAYILLSLTFWSNASAQIKPISIELVDSILQVEAKPMLILLSTDWCQYCQMQKAQIRKNKAFLRNAHRFHYIEFDAGSKKDIVFNTKSYAYQPTGINIGTHELAVHLNGDDHLVYPTWVIMNSNYDILFRNKGVLLPKNIDKLMEILKE